MSVQANYVRATATIPVSLSQTLHAMCASIGIDVGVAMKLAIQNAVALDQQGQPPFGSQPVASYRHGRRALSECLKLGITQDAFNVFYANVKTSKKITIANHAQFLDEGIANNWMYRDGSTNQKLCLRLLWALDQIVNKTAPVDWMQVAQDSALTYP